MNKQVNALLQKEMNRKEFLTTMGFGVASIFGFSTVIRMLNGKSTGFHRNASHGYGSSAYGK